MLVTQELATKMHCCGPEGCGRGHDKIEGGENRRYCIGSKCMAWRWGQRLRRPLKEGEIYVRQGYCGYAGKPTP